MGIGALLVLVALGGYWIVSQTKHTPLVTTPEQTDSTEWQQYGDKNEWAE